MGTNEIQEPVQSVALGIGTYRGEHVVELLGTDREGNKTSMTLTVSDAMNIAGQLQLHANAIFTMMHIAQAAQAMQDAELGRQLLTPKR